QPDSPHALLAGPHPADDPDAREARGRRAKNGRTLAPGLGGASLRLGPRAPGALQSASAPRVRAAGGSERGRGGTRLSPRAGAGPRAPEAVGGPRPRISKGPVAGEPLRPPQRLRRVPHPGRARAAASGAGAPRRPRGPRSGGRRRRVALLRLTASPGSGGG